MMRLAVVLVIGLVGGYSIGYNHGASGEPSVKQRVLELAGVNKVRDDAAKRQKAIEQLQKARADSIESAMHRTEVPHQ